MCAVLSSSRFLLAPLNVGHPTGRVESEVGCAGLQSAFPVDFRSCPGPFVEVSFVFMTRISFPDRGFGEHVDWALMRPQMAAGMGALSEAVYGNTKLAVREREAARWTIAQINDCAVCRDTRARDGEDSGADEGFYQEVTRWRTSTSLTDRERLAAEFAERFAVDHLGMDDDLWERMHAVYGEDELADLIICCGAFLGLGRTLAVVGVKAPAQRLLV
jgi:alkylhydroperoxidase family enzyme